MKIFLKYVGEFLMVFPQIRISRIEEVSIRDEVIKHLGLKSLNEMRDRFEGQAFFDKTLTNLGGLIAVQKHLEMPIVDITKIDLSNFSPKLNLDNRVLDIFVFEFGKLPMFDIDKLENEIFFVIQKDKTTFNLCGFSDIETIKKNTIEVNTKTFSQEGFKSFIGFSELNPPKDLILKS